MADRVFKYTLHILLCVMSIALYASCGSSESRERDYCKSLIEKSEAAYCQNDHSTSLKSLAEARLIAFTNGYHEYYVEVISRIAREFANLNDYSQAAALLQENIQYASLYANDMQQIKVLNNLGVVLVEMDSLEKAKSIFTEILNRTQKDSDKFSNACAAENLAWIAGIEGDKKSLDRFSSIVLDSSNNFKDLRLDNHLINSEYEMSHGNLQKGIALCDSISQIPEFADTPQRLSRILLTSAQLLTAANRFAEAEAKIRLAHPLCSDPSMRSKLYSVSQNFYKAQGNDRMALAYADSLLQTERTLTQLHNEVLAEYGMFAFKLSDTKAELLRQKNTLNIIATISIMSIIVLALVVISVHLKRKRDASEKSLLAKEKDMIALTLKLKAEETERLENELEAKNRELALKTLHLSRRNSLVKSVLEKTSVNAQLSPAFISELKASLLNDFELEDIISYFEKINTKFIDSLHARHPGLNANDVRYLCYVFMGLTSKETASLLNISNDAARKRKQRISEKLGLSDSDSLYSYITSL